METKVITEEQLKQLKQQKMYQQAKVNLGGLIRQSSKGTMKTFIKRWKDNIKENEPYFSVEKSLAWFKNKYKGRKVIVVGAGPSMDHQMKELYEIIRENPGKFVLLCVDAVCGMIEKGGLIPTFIMSADIHEKVVEYIDVMNWKKMPENTKPKLIMPIFANPQIKFLFDNYYFYTIEQNEEEFHKRMASKYGKFFNSLRASGNVGNMLIQFALYCGFSDVYMIGMDCCFPNGITHCKWFEKDGKQHTVNEIDPVRVGWGKDCRGLRVASTIQFLAYAEIAEDIAQQEKHVNFFNVGGYGLLGGPIKSKIQIIEWKEMK